METVIFSANPVQAFLPGFLTVGMLFVFGIVAVVAALIRKDQGRGARLALGAAGGFLMLAGAVACGLTLVSMTGGTRAVTAPLKDKQVAQQSCGEDDTCPHYMLTLESGATTYDFDVARSAFDQAEVGRCYQVTYYPGSGLFSNPAESQGYVTTANISRIARIDGGACQ